MFKKIHHKVWAFDIEWVPDPMSGMRIYNTDRQLTNEEIIKIMWKEGGATEENPMPYLKTVVCRIVSISAVMRAEKNNQVSLHLRSLPSNGTDSILSNEKDILSRFLNAIGEHKPQLVGYNSFSSDLKILIQRAIVNSIQAVDFCRRPAKPWDGIDYFIRGNDWHIDLQDIISGWGKSTPSLHEIALASKIPGKMDIDGRQVAQLWLDGKLDEIIRYNECDALTTYLLWLRMAYFGGFFTSVQYEEEQEHVRNLLKEKGSNPNYQHLNRYLEMWEKLNR